MTHLELLDQQFVRENALRDSLTKEMDEDTATTAKTKSDKQSQDEKKIDLKDKDRDSDDEGGKSAAEVKEEPIEFQRSCQQMKEFKLSRGYMTTIKPLVRCLAAFSKLRKLEISYIKLTKLQLMCIDNYLIQNSMLKTLKLMGVMLNYDGFKHIAGPIEVSKSLRHLNLSQNNLKNGGCREIANILKRNTSL